MPAPVLELVDVSFVVSSPNGTSIRVLNSVSFRIERGEKVAIVGPSGSGKSSILAICGLMEMPSAGNLFVGGIDVGAVSDAARARIRGEQFGYVFQNFSLQRNLASVANVELPLVYQGAHRRERLSRSTALLEQVGLGDRLHAKPKTLSGGEQQRVAIARALVVSPELILADEPTAALDLETGHAVFDVLIREIESRQCSLVVVTHDSAIADRCDRVLHLHNGTLNG
jgi:putative ABC transport system ATP-binding protein